MNEIKLSNFAGKESLKVATVQLLRNLCDRRADVVAMHREPCKFATLFPADILSLTFADGAKLSLFVKCLNNEEADHPEKQCRDREVRVYEGLLRNRHLPVPRYYGAHWDAASETTFLFLEHINDWNLKHQDIRYWHLAARHLAHLHSEFASQADVLRSASYLQQFDSHYFEAKAQAAVAVIRRRDRDLAYRLESIAQEYTEVSRLLSEAPATLVHNDLSPKNVLVDRSASPERICFVDWEMAGVGCGLLDLVQLKYGLDPKNDRHMIEVYCEHAAESPLLPKSQNDRDRLLAACELHRAIYLLASSAKWRLSVTHLAGWVQDAERWWDSVRE